MTTDAPPKEPLVRVENLEVKFVSRETTVYAVNGVNFTLDRGEILCILGEFRFWQERHTASAHTAFAVTFHTFRRDGHYRR